MSKPFGTATAPHSRRNILPIRVVADFALRRLIRDYRERRARLEKEQTNQYASDLYRMALRLQARTLSMVINDLDALAEGRPGRLDG